MFTKVSKNMVQAIFKTVDLKNGRLLVDNIFRKLNEFGLGTVFCEVKESQVLTAVLLLLGIRLYFLLTYDALDISKKCKNWKEILLSWTQKSTRGRGVALSGKENK